jgi:hypothetical protein
MIAADLFVGMTAVVIGLASLAAAIGNWDLLYQLPKLRWIESRAGRPAARLACVLLGAACIALGVAIACGSSLLRA